MSSSLHILGIHGINQHDVTPSALASAWTTALRESLQRLGHETDAIELPVVYYADLFHRHPTPQGEEQLNSEEALLLADWALDTVAVEAQGPVEEWIGQVAALIADRLDNVPKWLVERLMRIGAQDAGQYLNDQALRRDIRGRLADELNAHSPRVLIAHSLGSVVAWETLQTIPELHVDVLITIGSPLALPNAILPRLDPQPVAGRTRPPGVGRWVNVAHSGDLVAAVRSLKRTFPEVDDEFEVEVDQRDCHRADSYLKATRVAEVVYTFG
ncbi:hypothetical protein [Leifsonia sp. P73]|uniref:hypothetical protein n=1 Tax=Leifsonia sp. P73 TaxID=3423959 RepID=UPI003DA493FE